MSDRIRIKDIAKMANVSVGTVDRVIHGRSGVSLESQERVKNILKQLNYQPNMYASALASNKKYHFSCLIPSHQKGEYWTDIEEGIYKAVHNYSDFNVSVSITYYDPYNYNSFVENAEKIITDAPDGVILAPTAPTHTLPFVERLEQENIPYIYIDSNLSETNALSFFGQNSHQSGIFSAQMLSLLGGHNIAEVAIFRKINDGVIGSNQQERREIGFKEYMKKHFPECHIMEVDLAASSNDKDHEMLNKFFTQHPTLNLGITFNSKAYIVGEFLQEHSQFQCQLIGYDLLERNVRCLHNGSISLLIAQQPRLQGFKAVQTLSEHLILKKDVQRVNFMPIDLLSKENIDFYYNI